jgi:flagellar M-ring protein FliF
MGTRVVALLEPVLGPDHVRVNVTARLNPATVEQTEETYDPTMTAVRSKQTSTDATTTGAPGGGLAGVRGNQPPPAPDPKNPNSAQSQQAQAVAQAQQTQQAQYAAATATGSGASRSAETVNYEVNRKLVVTQRPPGEIARLSLAVIVDDEAVSKKGSDGRIAVTRRPRTPEELQRLQEIVAAAVGLEPERGDQLTVQNVSFEEPAVEAAAPLTTLQQVTRYSTQIWDGARLLAIVVLGALAMIFFVRPLMRRANAGLLGPAGEHAALAGPGQPVRTVADLESEIEAQLDASAQQKLDSRRLPVLARKVSAMSAKEPENVAKLLRSWINEGER